VYFSKFGTTTSELFLDFASLAA